MIVVPVQIAAARKMLGLSQAELAGLAGVSTSTVRAFEAARRDINDSAAGEMVCAALKRAGIEFVENTAANLGVGVRLKNKTVRLSGPSGVISSEVSA